MELFRTGHGRNDYAYSNESFDALLVEIARERVPARRNRMMHEAERLLLADAPIIPVYTYVTKRLVDRHVQGWQHNVMDHHYSRSMFKLKSRTRTGLTPEPAPAGPDSETGPAPAAPPEGAAE
jgi:oligopeptide transport system substrate-binding protein